MGRKGRRNPGTTAANRRQGVARGATRQRGFTFFEMLMVVLIVGMLASVMLPSLAPGENIKLDLVAAELADAMRFARSEAIRLGEPMGFRQESSGNRIRVFRMDTRTVPATLVYDIYHPVDRNVYDRQLKEPPYAFTGQMADGALYRGICDAPGSIYFDAAGVPWCADPADVLVESLSIKLSLGAGERVVTLHGINGRVTIR